MPRSICPVIFVVSARSTTLKCILGVTDVLWVFDIDEK